MDGSRFDILARSLTDSSSRRGILRGLAAALGLQAAHVSPGADAKKRKRPQPNEFGCLNVGQACGGKDGRCCSGICQGKKPKKGEKDTSRCVAHDTGGCQAGQQSGFCGGTDVGCTTATGKGGFCDTTTGNAGFCTVGGDCFPCTKDADCRPFCGSQAACVRCLPECDGEGGTACFGPDECDFSVSLGG